MKSARTYLAVLFFLTTVGLSLFAYRQYEANLELTGKLLDPKTGLQKELDDANATIKRLRDELAALKVNLGRRRVAADGPDSPPDGGPGGPNGRGDRRAAFMALMDSPQFQSLRAIQDKVQIDSRYADLFKLFAQQYNLTPQQIDQFKSLLAQRQQATMDAAQAARQNGINPRSDPDAFRAAIDTATADIDSQMKSAVGDPAYGAYQTYQQTAPQRATVSQLQQSLSYTSAPLTDAQSQQLVTLLQQSGAGAGGNGPVFGAWNGGGGPAGTGPTAQITNAIVTQAAAFLNSSQVSALQQIQQAQQAQQQMGQLLRAQLQGRQNGGTGG